MEGDTKLEILNLSEFNALIEKLQSDVNALKEDIGVINNFIFEIK